MDSKIITNLSTSFIQALGLIQRGNELRMTDDVLVFASRMIAFGLPQIAVSVLELFPDSPAASFLKGKVYIELSRFEKAKECFEKATSGLCNQTF